ncbi:MAG: ABC transporter ATP-binding protein [Actinomycetes bacterium]
MLDVTDLTVRFGDPSAPTVAVDDVSLHVPAGTVTCVLGPSGCGKSTLLRAVAGLERPSAGRVAIGGRDVTALRPDQRDVGLMFQDHALFPHRDVAANVAFGPRMRGWAAGEIERAVAGALALVGLDGFDRRDVASLSGGEAQRVALARALAPRPGLLLLDEPLGSLDRGLRDRLLEELPGVFAAAGATVVHVTHDQDEALTLADEVVLLREGRVVQQGPPAAVWAAPADAWAARFLGIADVLDLTVRAGVAASPIGEVATGLPDGPAALIVPPGALTLDDGAALRGTVTGRRFAGDHTVLTVSLAGSLAGSSAGGGLALHVGVLGAPAVTVGDAVGLRVDRAALRVVPA